MRSNRRDHMPIWVCKDMRKVCEVRKHRNLFPCCTLSSNHSPPPSASCLAVWSDTSQWKYSEKIYLWSISGKLLFARDWTLLFFYFFESASGRQPQSSRENLECQDFLWVPSLNAWLEIASDNHSRISTTLLPQTVFFLFLIMFIVYTNIYRTGTLVWTTDWWGVPVHPYLGNIMAASFGQSAFGRDSALTVYTITRERSKYGS